ncbi:hypothetical protein A2U01_0096287, partial [Trifolium medium]|nr:hypothetical protein [Trifolium medium]
MAWAPDQSARPSFPNFYGVRINSSADVGYAEALLMAAELKAQDTPVVGTALWLPLPRRGIGNTVVEPWTLPL